MSALLRPPNAENLIPAGSGSLPSDMRRYPRISVGRRSSDLHEPWGNSAVLLARETAGRLAADVELARVDRMVAIFGHDLRVLLNALSINAEVCMRQMGEDARKNAGNLQNTVGQMDRLVSSLLDYARLRATNLHVDLRPVDMAELIREAVETFRALAHSRSLALDFIAPETPLLAMADSERVLQVLSNLLSNAIKFTSANGRIIVRADTVGPDLQVAVVDEGCGIFGDDLERVFECFHQLPGADPQGLGLGLYISRAIVEAHGGSIWATSSLGSGSTFTFTVPRSESVPPPPD